MFIFGTGGIVFFALLVLWVWALFDCIATETSKCRNLPKVVWLILVLLLPDLGAIAWLFLGRPKRAGWRPGSTETRASSTVTDDAPVLRSDAAITDRRSAELDRRLDEHLARERELGADGGSASAAESGPED